MHRRGFFGACAAALIVGNRLLKMGQTEAAVAGLEVTGKAGWPSAEQVNAWALVNGPPWLTINAETGVLSGAENIDGVFRKTASEQRRTVKPPDTEQ
jgi:hypothetical protein